MDGETKAKLDSMHEDIVEIKTVVKPLVLDVDRLKRSRAIITAILWTVFAAVIGVGTAAIGSSFLSH